jgi:hypothetical protein
MLAALTDAERALIVSLWSWSRSWPSWSPAPLILGRNRRYRVQAKAEARDVLRVHAPQLASTHRSR